MLSTASGFGYLITAKSRTRSNKKGGMDEEREAQRCTNTWRAKVIREWHSWTR